MTKIYFLLNARKCIFTYQNETVERLSHFRMYKQSTRFQCSWTLLHPDSLHDIEGLDLDSYYNLTIICDFTLQFISEVICSNRDSFNKMQETMKDGLAKMSCKQMKDGWQCFLFYFFVLSANMIWKYLFSAASMILNQTYNLRKRVKHNNSNLFDK